MAIGEIFAKGVVVIKGDTSHARAEISKLSAEEQKAAKARIKAQEEHNAALERSNQRFQLYVAGAVAGWAIVSKSLKTYEDHLKSLGASGESELKRLQDASRNLDGAQRNLEIAIGKVAAAAVPAANALADMANELANIVSGIGGVVRAASNLPGAGPVGTVLGYAVKYGGPVNQARALGSLAVTGIGNVYDNIRGTATINANSSDINGPSDYDQWQYQQDAQAGWRRAIGQTSNTQSLLGEEGTQAIQYIDQESGRLLARTLRGKAEKFFTNAGRGLGLVESNRARGGRGGARQYSDPLSEIFGYARDTFDQSGLGNLGDIYTAGGEANADRAAKFGGLGGIGSQWQSVALPQSLLDQLDKGQGELEKSAMEKIVGPIEQFDAYATAFGMVSDAASSAYEAIVTGSESAGAAIKRVIGGEVMALGKSMLVHSLQEGAWAIAELARGNLPSAATHGKAAALFLAGSVAAGVVASQLGAGGSSSVGRGNSYAAAGIGGGGGANYGNGGGGGGSQVPVYVVLGDSFGYESERSRNQRLREGVQRAGRVMPAQGVVYS